MANYIRHKSEIFRLNLYLVNFKMREHLSWAGEIQNRQTAVNPSFFIESCIRVLNLKFTIRHVLCAYKMDKEGYSVKQKSTLLGF